MNKLVVSVFALSLFSSVSFASETLSVDWQPARKHICAFGWEWGNASPDHLLKVADQLADNGISGVSIYLSVKGDSPYDVLPMWTRRAVTIPPSSVASTTEFESEAVIGGHSVHPAYVEARNAKSSDGAPS